MRALLILAPALLLGACQVTEDKANDSVTLQYNEDLAKEAAADTVNGAKEAGAAIANGAEKAADRAQNVDVDVDTNTADNKH